jgi:hypothetical protein
VEVRVPAVESGCADPSHGGRVSRGGVAGYSPPGQCALEGHRRLPGSLGVQSPLACCDG